MKLTPTELALIAVELAKMDDSTPEANFAAAKNLFTKAANYLVETSAKTGRARFKMAYRIGRRMELAEFLKINLPTIGTPSLRQRRFHEFLTLDYLPKLVATEPTEISIELQASHFINEAKKSGVSANSYPRLKQWHDSRVSLRKAENAHKMHDQRKMKQKTKEIEQATNSKATEKKSRVEYHDPEALERIANEQVTNTKKRPTISLHG